MCSSCGSQIDPKKGKLESGHEITLTLHTQGERYMDGWIDCMDEPFSQLFLHRQKAQSKEKRSLEDEYNISSCHFLQVDSWMDAYKHLPQLFVYSTKWGLSSSPMGELLIESPILGFWT